jgi:glycosyltransferase involved in cell wall biosynthesis
VQSPGVKDCLLSRGVPEEKVSVIYNWCDETNTKFSLSIKNELIQSKDDHLGSFKVLFAGNLGKAQDLDTIVEAANLLKNENSAVRIFLLGGGIEVPRLKKNIDVKNITNICILPPVPMSEVGKFLASSDALLVHLKDCPLFRITIPAKVQAYMAAGKPILMAVAGDASRLITNSGAGICSLPSNARSIADSITKLSTSNSSLLKKMGENGQAYYWANMSMDVGVRKFLEIFKIVLKEKNSHV